MRLAGPQPRALDLRPGSNVALLLGDNACGKTTFLDAAAYALDAFVSGMTGSPLRRIPASDVHIDAEGRMAEEMGIRWRLTTPAGEALEACITRSGAGRARKSRLGGIRSYAASLREEGATLPVAAYYGTGRGHIKASLGSRPFRRAQSRTDCYRHALDPSSPLRGLFRWFALMEDFERKRGEALRDPERTLPQLDAVRRAAGVFVGDRFHSPRIASQPWRFVMSGRGGICLDREMRIEQMSDGYRILLAMAADIAARMAQANPAMPDPLQTPGIVLIDEIDLHLHPKWQRTVVGNLAEAFPNVQFILTTHSPVVVAGALGKAQIIRLADDGEPSGGASVDGDLQGCDVGQLLLSGLFGLGSLRAPMWDGKLSRRRELLARTSLSGDEKAELAALDRELLRLNQGHSPEEARAAALIEELARRLGTDMQTPMQGQSPAMPEK